MRLLILIVMILTNSAALSNKPAPEELNKEFFLKLGQTTTIKTDDLKISFDKVLEDSRCPKGVQCIQAGNGRIKIKVSKAGQAEQSLELDTNEHKSTATYDHYQIKMTQLLPYPDRTESAQKSEYKAGLVITKK